MMATNEVNHRNESEGSTVTRLVDISNTRLIRAYIRQHRRHAASTLRDRELFLGRLAGWLAEPNLDGDELPPCTLATATPDHLVEFVAGLPIGKSREAWAISSLRGFYRWLVVEEQARNDDPTIRLHRPRLPRWRPRPADEDQARDALVLAHADPLIYLWLRLAWFAGLRCCDIASVRTDSLYRKSDRYWLRVSGKGSPRPVPLDDTTAELLRAHLRACVGSGPVFRGPGGPYTAHRLGQKANEFLHDAGLRFTMHQLRHGFATDYYEVDPDALRLKEILGHSNVETVLVYTQVAVGPAAAAVQESADHRDPDRRRRAG